MASSFRTCREEEARGAYAANAPTPLPACRLRRPPRPRISTTMSAEGRAVRAYSTDRGRRSASLRRGPAITLRGNAGRHYKCQWPIYHPAKTLPPLREMPPPAPQLAVGVTRTALCRVARLLGRADAWTPGCCCATSRHSAGTSGSPPLYVAAHPLSHPLARFAVTAKLLQLAAARSGSSALVVAAAGGSTACGRPRDPPFQRNGSTRAAEPLYQHGSTSRAAMCTMLAVAAVCGPSHGEQSSPACAL